MSDGLAQRAWRAVARTVGSGSAEGTNALGRISIGHVVSVVADLGRALLGVGVGLAIAPIRIVANTAVGHAISQLVTGAASAATSVATAVSTILTARDAARVTAGIEVVQVKFDLSGVYGASAATNTTVSGAAWTNTGNATGAPDGSVSSHAGTVSAQDAYLDFAFPAMTGKTQLAIQSVKLRYWCRQTGTVLNNGSLRIFHGTAANPGATLVRNDVGDVDYTAVPLEVDLTATVTTWAQAADLRARIRHTADAAETHTGAVDAVQLLITATHTHAT